MYTASSRPVVIPSSVLKYSAAWHKILLITCLHLHYILEEEGMVGKTQIEPMFLHLLASPLPQIIFYYTIIITFLYYFIFLKKWWGKKKIIWLPDTWLFYSSHKNWRLAMKTSSQSLKCRHDSHYKFHHKCKCVLYKWRVMPLLEATRCYFRFSFSSSFEDLLAYKKNNPCQSYGYSNAMGLTQSHSSKQRKKERSLSALCETFSLKNEKSVCSMFTDVCFQSFLPRKYYDSGFTPSNTLDLILHVLGNLRVRKNFMPQMYEKIMF